MSKTVLLSLLVIAFVVLFYGCNSMFFALIDFDVNLLIDETVSIYRFYWLIGVYVPMHCVFRYFRSVFFRHQEYNRYPRKFR